VLGKMTLHLDGVLPVKDIHDHRGDSAALVSMATCPYSETGASSARSAKLPTAGSPQAVNSGRTPTMPPELARGGVPNSPQRVRALWSHPMGVTLARRGILTVFGSLD